MASIRLTNSLTTLERAKAYLGITGSTQNAAITALIIATSSFVESYCRRSFKRRAVTNELVNGGGSKIFPIVSPIDSAQSITVDRRTTEFNEDSWDGVDSNLIFTDANGRYISSYVPLSDGVQNYRISYTGGYYLPSDALFDDGTNEHLDLPADLEMAVWDLVALKLNTKKSAGITSERVRDVGITYQKILSDNPTIKETLDSYKVLSYA